MIWTEEAQKALARVPFFVRGKVRCEIEKEAAEQGSHSILLRHVRDCREKFLSGKSFEPRGFQLETCFGSGGCENRAIESEALVDELERLLVRRNIAGFLKKRLSGPLKMHHEFRICVSECPSACSRPQSVDIGIIGSLCPRISCGSCTGCGVCATSCIENALEPPPGADAPRIDRDKCVMCGKCVSACPSGAMREGRKGWRILVGGKLGRHPQLGRELEGIHSKKEVLAIVERCLDIYLANNIDGERFAAILNRIGYDLIESPED